jgi:hypothetical protein
MKQSLFKTSVQPMATRTVYGTKLNLKDPYQKLAASVLLQAALDDIHRLRNGGRIVGMFGKDWEFYSGMIGLNMNYEDFLMAVYQSKLWNRRIQRTATAWIDHYIL